MKIVCVAPAGSVDNMSLVSESEASGAGGGNARYRKAAKGGKQHAHAATSREPSTLSRLLRSVGGRGSRNVLAVEGLDSSARMAFYTLNLSI